MSAQDGGHASLLQVLPFLFTPTSLVLIGTAVATVYLSALRAVENERFLGKAAKQDLLLTIDGCTALALPILGSAMLLAMFYFFASFSQVFTLLSCASSGAAVIFTLMPLSEATWRALGLHTESLASPEDGCSPHRLTTAQQLSRTPRHVVVLAIMTTCLVLAWLVSGHWVLNNVLGCCLCAFIISFVRLPNMKVCALLLTCLFVYDVFWVFFSPRFFGSNVMLRVAEQKASNPIHTAAAALNMSSASLAKQLDPPVKIKVPRQLLSGSPKHFSILGLGDIALPGMLLALGACFDQRRCKNEPAATLKTSPMHSLATGASWPGGTAPKQGAYLLRATLGYLAGILSAMLGGMMTRSPQPALMYLVPAVLLPVLYTAWERRELREVWDGQRPRFCSCCPFPGRTSQKEPDEDD